MQATRSSAARTILLDTHCANTKDMSTIVEFRGDRKTTLGETDTDGEEHVQTVETKIESYASAVHRVEWF